ncbi:putative protein UPF0748 [Clostridium aceticum]|uniref:LPXTG-motif cell wall anchor domain-containing protein n=1 Tax=Clostridium aceticum TaxID=84022 RepID=A0A0G3WCF8_9CLOT|nr:hypothetical protein [Clostridium aceticum]AKL96008.1 putative protein UPF0748 [Clostridium aceticum]
MIKSKFTKTLVVGICFAALSSSMAFASGDGSQPSLVSDQMPVEQVEVDERQVENLLEMPVDSSDASISYLALEPREITEEIVEKQKEVDQYLFEENNGEISQKGFKATHTAPFDDYVEIGITPYSEENAEYLYEIFGRDMIQIVEGQEAELYSTTVVSGGIEADVVMTRSEGTPKSRASNTPLYLIGGSVLIGAGIISKRKIKLQK